MISFSELLGKMEEESKKNNLVRRKVLHLSEVAICGFKYRYRLDNNLFIPFKLEFHVGNAFEFTMVNQMKKMKNIISQYSVPYIYGENEFIGHTDAYEINENIIYELKSSFSRGDYSDIYIRQLKAYMIANYKYTGNFSKGVLWYYNFVTKTYKETIFDTITDYDRELLNKNLDAFTNNKYVDGIENSLCSFCENEKCPMWKVKNYRKKKYGDI